MCSALVPDWGNPCRSKQVFIRGSCPVCRRFSLLQSPEDSSRCETWKKQPLELHLADRVSHLLLVSNEGFPSLCISDILVQLALASGGDAMLHTGFGAEEGHPSLQTAQPPLLKPLDSCSFCAVLSHSTLYISSAFSYT